MGSAVEPHVDPRHYLREKERSPTGRSCPFYNSHLEPIVSPVGCPLCTFYGTSPVDKPSGENKPLVVLHVPIADPTQVSACGCKTVPRHSPKRPPSFRSVALRDKFTISGAMWVLLRRRSSVAVTLFLIVRSSGVSTDIPIVRTCCRRRCRSTSW